MKRTLRKPPLVLDNARVVEYAVLNNSVNFSGRTLLFVEGKELGPLPCLAICENLEDAAILLFHCDRDWTVLGVARYGSISEAKNRAERTYPGVSNRWIETQSTELEVSKYLEDLSANECCTFCGKGPGQAEILMEKNCKWICDACAIEFHQMLQEDSKGKD